MIKRQLETEIKLLQKEFPVIAIVGPRQSGKSTLAQMLFPTYEYLSLEDIDQREFAKNDPRGFFGRYERRVIIDEIQKVPELMSYLQTHVDNLRTNGEIVITGSHNLFLMEQISQSLAGRVGITKLLPFSVNELPLNGANWKDLVFNGMYPRIYDQGIRPQSFYKNYIATYIEKDLRQLKQITKLDQFMGFMKILAGRTGQELNTSTLSDECGVSHNTIRDWISVLEASFIVYKLKPFHKNYNKRIVKNPKIYFTDTGLVCSLIGIRKPEELDYHFLKGSLFETFIMSEFVKANYNSGEVFELYYWRDNHKKELDLILDFGGIQFGVEIKSSETINEKYFDGLRYWIDLTETNENQMYLIYGGNESQIRNEMHVVPWNRVFDRIVKPLL